MKDEKIKERKGEELKNKLRDRIHPEIIHKAHPVKNNSIRLIKLFYPKTRISSKPNRKDLLKAFKRALANFHPDKTLNKDLLFIYYYYSLVSHDSLFNRNFFVCPE